VASLGAILLAAGSSSRMAGGDKLFLPLGGRPLLSHSLATFQASPLVGAIILVMSSENLERGQALASEGGFDKVAAVCLGGARRQDSVRAGLAALPACDWVAVHDGARPLVTAGLIDAGLAAAQGTGAAVPAVRLSDTVKEAGADGIVRRTLDREQLWAVQTPQFFRRDLLEEAHRKVQADVTDDAAMLEALGHEVAVFPGSPLNLKITTADDLSLAEALLALAASRNI